VWRLTNTTEVRRDCKSVTVNPLNQSSYFDDRKHTADSILERDGMLPVNIPSAVNDYVTVVDAASGFDAFLCRFRIQGQMPVEAVKVAPNECVVGFARRCTHMGCRLLTETAAGASRPLPMPDGLLRCACHASCFDLLASGLVVMGPATDWLPALQLTAVPDPKTGAITSVRIDGWSTTRSVPYGIPFAGTTAKPLIP
jgi:Rieske Fe-S protein